MNNQNTPAPAGKNIRVLLVSALFMSLVAGAFVMPAMANPMYDVCMAQCNLPNPPFLFPNPPNDPGRWLCEENCLQYLFTPYMPLPCCTYGPFAEPYCLGFDKCIMNPVVETTS